MFLLALPAGVLADTTDRRRLILAALLDAGRFRRAAGGAAVRRLGRAGHADALHLHRRLLHGAAVAGLELDARRHRAARGTAAGDHRWSAWPTTRRARSGRRSPASCSRSAARWNFVLCVVSTLLMAQAIRRWPPAPHPPSRLPAERLWGGMLSALRFARHSQTILAQLVRTVAYSACGSALWALLPVIGQRQLGLGAAGVGLLMGCLGAGAVGAGLVLGAHARALRPRSAGRGRLPRLRGGDARGGVRALADRRLRWRWCSAGASWMSVMSTFNTATQTSAPPWVRARAVVAARAVRARARSRSARRSGARCRACSACTAALSLAAALMVVEHLAGAPVSAAHGRSRRT